MLFSLVIILTKYIENEVLKFPSFQAIPQICSTLPSGKLSQNYGQIHHALHGKTQYTVCLYGPSSSSQTWVPFITQPNVAAKQLNSSSPEKTTVTNASSAENMGFAWFSGIVWRITEVQDATINSRIRTWKAAEA